MSSSGARASATALRAVVAALALLAAACDAGPTPGTAATAVTAPVIAAAPAPPAPVRAAASPVTIAAAPAPVDAAARAEAQAFWTAFRAAVEKGDWTAVAAMSAQPLTVRGAVDGIAPNKVSGRKTAGILRQHLTQPLFAGRGKPMRSAAEWLRDTPTLAARHWVAPDQIRFQNLAFRKGPQGWKLATVYDEES